MLGERMLGERWEIRKGRTQGKGEGESLYSCFSEPFTAIIDEFYFGGAKIGFLPLL
jgi:hypothetical protein